MKESDIYKELAIYLLRKKLLYRFDIAADIKLTKGQAKKVKATFKHRRGYPDLFILEPVYGYSGLFLEIKKEYSDAFKLDGGLKKSVHLEEQDAYHKSLRSRGYCVEWGLGLKDCVEKIEKYLEDK